MSRAGLRLAVAAAAAVGCGIPAEGPMMQPGRNCLSCHSAGGGADPPWTAAGTVFPRFNDPADAGVQGVHVTLVDAGGRSITLSTNAAGNFYTREPLLFPVRASIEKAGTRRAMVAPAPHGGCNACHGDPAPLEVSAGRIALAGGGASPLMNPGDACQACHDGVAARSFAAAGTVYLLPTAAVDQGAAGVTVRITGATGLVTTLVSNAAGNFYSEEPIAFPAQVEVELGGVVKAMGDALPHGDCNACHSPLGEAGGRVGLQGDD
jgi:hypothetical protein